MSDLDGAELLPVTSPTVKSFSLAVEASIAAVRDEVAHLHYELVRIKPSGVDYDDLEPANMILCDLDGSVIPGTPGSERSPSSDTAAHAYVYRNMPWVGGVVHTHSTYATAWAARGEIVKPFPLMPSDEEIQRNPRARSAKLRVATKI